MNVLLTDEAVRAGGAKIRSWNDKNGELKALHAARLVEIGFLQHHATEGREALVEKVRHAILRGRRYDPEVEDLNAGRDEAEAVVTALFGEATDG